MVSYNVRVPFYVTGQRSVDRMVKGTVRWTEAGDTLYLSMSSRTYDRVRERLGAEFFQLLVADFSVNGCQAPDIVVIKNDRPIRTVPCRRIY